PGGADSAAAPAGGRRGWPAVPVGAGVRGAVGPGESAGNCPPERRPLRRAARRGPARRGGRRPGHGHCDLEHGAAAPLLLGSAAAVSSVVKAPIRPRSKALAVIPPNVPWLCGIALSPEGHGALPS